MTAGLIALYNYELIAIDGATCADRTAPGGRLDQLYSQGGDVFAFLKQQSPELKTKLAEGAITMENETASRRKDDKVLCMGMDAILAGLESGEQHKTKGKHGRGVTVTEVETPSGWSPKFLTPVLPRMDGLIL